MRPDSSSGSDGRFVPLRWRSGIVQALLGVTILLDVIAAGLVFVEIGLVGDVMHGRPVDLEALRTNTDRATGLGTATITLLAVTAVAWWIWQYRGQANLVATGRGGLSHRPWGAVGWWVVPIANLWMPFKTMRELWRASEPVESPVGWRSVKTWSVLGWWWGLWIVGNLLQSATGLVTETTELDVIRNADVVAVVGLGFEIFAACLAIGVVRQITKRQTALAALVAGGTSVAPGLGTTGDAPAIPPAPVPPPPPPPPPSLSPPASGQG